MLKTDVVKHFGTQEKVAEVLQLTRQAVSAWPDIVPEGMAYKLQVLTAGALRVRQDLYKPRSAEHRA